MRVLEPLAAEIQGLLERLRVEPRLLGSAHIPFLRERGWNTCADPNQPSIGTADVQSSFNNQLAEAEAAAAALLEGLGNEPEGRPIGVRRTWDS